MRYPALYDALRRLAEVPKAEWLEAEALGQELAVPRRGCFLRPGEPADRFGFVLEGLFKVYRVTEDGGESVKAFRAEGEFVAAYAELLLRQSSKGFVEALEPSRVLAFRTAHLDALERRHPCWTQVARRIAEQQYLVKEKREQEFLDLQAAERLERFWDDHPRLKGRLPQREVAAYLGITDVALSRIVTRRRKAARR